MSYVPGESQQIDNWTQPVIISTSTVSETVVSWFPDLTVDDFNSVHTVWCLTNISHTTHDTQPPEQLIYSRQTRAGWSQPNDIVPPSLDIIRNSITTDLNGHVLLLYSGSVHGRPLTLYFTQANVNDAWSAQAWSPYVQINHGASYMGDIAVDSHGVIHVIYDDSVRYPWQENQEVYADIYYRKSFDGGKTWTIPVNLANSPDTGSARPYLEIGSDDTLHVTWDEGWDRFTGAEANSLYSAYTYSKDGGESWSIIKIISYPTSTTGQLTVGSNGKGGVMLVWRSTLDQNVYFQWSNDGGVTWSVKPTIHGIYTRQWTIPFDMYDMASDSNGNIHLILVGQRNETDSYPGVYHLVWDGKRWSDPQLIFYQDNLYPEYTKIVIYGGNQIHAVWFTREKSVWEQTGRVIWYSRSQVDAPTVTIIPRPTPTVPLPTFTHTPRPSVTPRPTISSEGISTASPIKEKEYLTIIMFVLSPVALLLGVVFLITLSRSHNRF